MDEQDKHDHEFQLIMARFDDLDRKMDGNISLCHTNLKTLIEHEKFIVLVKSWARFGTQAVTFAVMAILSAIGVKRWPWWV